MRKIGLLYWLRRLAAFSVQRRRKRTKAPQPPKRPGNYRRFFTHDRRVEDIQPKRKGK